jgi:histidine triad (HIT) family protein
VTSIFTKIIKGSIPSYKVGENDSFLAFLDINPIAYGHVLVIPKKEIDYIFDMNSTDYLKLFDFAKKVANAMEKVIFCQRIGIAVIGLEVPHVHIHLIPLNTISDINFENEKLNFSDLKMNEIAHKINSAI